MSGRIVVILSGLCLILSACNLPINNNPTPDLLATEVSNLLTASPIAPSATQISETDQFVEQLTPSSTATEQPLPTNTETTTITPSPTPANVPTGTPTWIDTFDNGTSFGISGSGYDDGNTKIYVESGSLILDSINGIGWRGWRLTNQKPVNYYLKAVFTTGECSGSDQYGLLVQSPDYDSGFGLYFGLTCDGRFSIQKWDDSGLTNLDGWNTSSSIQSGSNQTNTIAILKSGNQYKYYVNDSVQSEVTNDSFSSPGFLGPFIAGLETPNFIVKIDEISYWKMP